MELTSWRKSKPIKDAGMFFLAGEKWRSESHLREIQCSQKQSALETSDLSNPEGVSCFSVQIRQKQKQTKQNQFPFIPQGCRDFQKPDRRWDRWTTLQTITKRNY
jgi:hypothetical protein